MWVRWGSDGQVGVRCGSDGGQMEVRCGSDVGQVGVRCGSGVGPSRLSGLKTCRDDDTQLQESEQQNQNQLQVHAGPDWSDRSWTGSV